MKNTYLSAGTFIHDVKSEIVGAIRSQTSGPLEQRPPLITDGQLSKNSDGDKTPTDTTLREKEATMSTLMTMSRRLDPTISKRKEK